MADSEAPSPNYTLSAFLEPIHLILMGLITFLFVADIGVEGLAVVGVLELIYLLIVPRLVPYKRRARLKEGTKQVEDKVGARERLASSLSRDVRRRYQAIAERHRALLPKVEPLPVGRETLDDLLDAALELCLLLQAHAEAEAREPIEALRNKAQETPNNSVLQVRLETREASQLQAQEIESKLGEIEASLETLQLHATSAQSAQVDSAAISTNVDVALKTAREMASLSIRAPQG